MNTISGKYTIEYAEAEHCYVVRSLDKNDVAAIATITVPKIVRLLKLKLKLNYRDIAEFCNITSNKVFRLAFTSHMGKHLSEYESLNECLVIDPEKGTAKFFHHDHKPASAERPHIPVTIEDTTGEVGTVTVRIPTKLTTRVRINDPLSRTLSMSIAPTGGYVLGVKDNTLCEPDATFYVAGEASSLNDLLRRIHFVGVKPGEAGKLVITVNDNEGKSNSTATTTLNFQQKEGVVTSIPTITIPPKIKAKIGADTKITTPITVADADGKLVALNIYPYNCEVYGWKSRVDYIGFGEMHTSTGRPELVNDDIADLHVRALKENAQLGLELLCGKTVIRDYLVFEVEPADNEVSPPSPPSEKPVPEMTGNDLTGDLNAKVNLGVAFTDNGYDKQITLTITPTGCAIENYGGQPIAAGSSKQDTGTVAQLNGKLAAAKVQLTTAKGTVKFDWNGGKTKTINTTGNSTQPESKVPELTANEIRGKTGAKVALGASLSTDGVTADQSLDITPEGCTFEGLPNGNGKNTLKGKVAQINTQLAKAKVVIGSGNGSVSFAWNNGAKTKKVTVTNTDGVLAG